MPISEKTRKTIWGLSGNRCAFPGCNSELFLTVGASSALVGEELHTGGSNQCLEKKKTKSGALLEIFL